MCVYYDSLIPIFRGLCPQVVLFRLYVRRGVWPATGRARLMKKYWQSIINIHTEPVPHSQPSYI